VQNIVAGDPSSSQYAILSEMLLQHHPGSKLIVMCRHEGPRRGPPTPPPAQNPLDNAGHRPETGSEEEEEAGSSRQEEKTVFISNETRAMDAEEAGQQFSRAESGVSSGRFITNGEAYCSHKLYQVECTVVAML